MKTFGIAFVFLFTLSIVSAQITQPVITLKKLWETGPGLKIPESVLNDTLTGIIYVSNVDGNPSVKDSSGFISTLSPDGKIINADWVKGLDAPKGMGILNNHLFVSNIDEVVEIDIPTATIVKRYPVKGSTFLNDIAIDSKTGMIFISDSRNGEVYVMLNGKVSLWLQGPMFDGANGLFLRDSILFIGTGNSILQTDIRTGNMIVSVPNTGGVDGLYITPDNNFIFSDWKGSVFISRRKRKPELLLNTTPQKVNAADFGIISSKNMILIPTFGDNKVVCYTSEIIK